ncbi:MAG: AzlD domain-containing protein [Acidimicrobiales bacterium]
MTFVESAVLVAIVAAGTYLSRAGMILLLAGRDLPERVLRALRYVGPAVLAALIVTFVADPDQAQRGITAAELAGLAASAGTHHRWKNLGLTLVVGMVVFWIVREIVQVL